MTITGTGFVPGATTVTFDGVPATAVTPAGVAGPAAVVVSTAAGNAAPLDYTYVAPGGGGAPTPGPGGDGGGADAPAGPSVVGLDPDSGPTSGGTMVTVRGRNFVPGQTSVIICGTTLQPSEVHLAVDGESLSFTTPECGAGVADVVVVTPDGAAGSLPFTYIGGMASNGTLPNTGADVTGLTLWGISLLVIGAALARRARRRPAAVA